ncbi:hypothetical protein KFK09_007630 [Dendrobium nobile]|uniref:DNA polymerase epsilon catalytic subunit n=1 Tax=Dendrobium nobile TaxID=94219 RepID=A0A8T3BUW2_DENNO|nr:hypothetical protein KFK09_007630 [Dendrobium nobile]
MAGTAQYMLGTARYLLGTARYMLRYRSVPQGYSVSERAIPVAIFGAEAASFFSHSKIITIPAAMQKVSNPVPRVLHPEWLHKKVREKEDRFRQRKLVDIFSTRGKNSNDASVRDLEDIVNSGNSLIRLVGMNESHQSAAATKLPVYKHTREKNGLNSFFRKHELALLKSHWQVIQFVSSTKPGFFLAWIVVDGVMLKINLDVPRIFYLNSKAPVTEEFPGRRVNKILPHSRPTFNLIEVVIDEEQFRAESKKLASHLADPEVEGIYETKVPLEFNAVLQIGCVARWTRLPKLEMHRIAGI